MSNTPATLYKRLSFDGIDDMVTITDHASIQNVFDGGGTVEIVGSVPADLPSSPVPRLISKGPWWFGISQGPRPYRPKMQYVFSGTIGQFFTAQTPDELPLIGIIDYIISYDADAAANEPEFLIDGEDEYSVRSPAPTGTRTTDAASDLLIGNVEGGLAPIETVVYAFRIYSSGLTEEEKTYNKENPYNPVQRGLIASYGPGGIAGSTWSDESLNSNDGTITGATTTEGNALAS